MSIDPAPETSPRFAALVACLEPYDDDVKGFAAHVERSLPSGANVDAAVVSILEREGVPSDDPEQNIVAQRIISIYVATDCGILQFEVDALQAGEQTWFVSFTPVTSTTRVQLSSSTSPALGIWTLRLRVDDSRGYFNQGNLALAVGLEIEVTTDPAANPLWDFYHAAMRRVAEMAAPRYVAPEATTTPVSVAS